MPKTIRTTGEIHGERKSFPPIVSFLSFWFAGASFGFMNHDWSNGAARVAAAMTMVLSIVASIFDKSGSPAVKIRIAGPFGQGDEFDAILDTGFTGFVCMPLLRALPLGLMLYGTTSVELADGSTSMKLTAKGMATVEGESQVGVVILEPTANDILVGMAFLRAFEKALFVTRSVVFLIDESRTPDEAETASERSGNLLLLKRKPYRAFILPPWQRS